MTTTRAQADWGLVVATSPRRDSLVGITEFLGFGREWRRKEPRIRALVVVMPSQTAPGVRDKIIAMLQPEEHLAEMAPAAGGCGPLFEAVCDFAFRLVPGAKAVVHLPIDLACGEIHESDVQLKIPEMSTVLDTGGPELLLGDYNPAAWRSGRSERHVAKELTGRAAREQLKHYGMDGALLLGELDEVRTEFFAAHRTVYESAAAAGAFAPYDPIPFVALHAWENGFRVKSIMLGTFYELDASRDPIRARDQILRFALQAASVYMRRMQGTGMAELATRTKTGKRTVVAGIKKAFDAMAAIPEEITGTPEVASVQLSKQVPLLDDAILLAVQSHHGQLDRAGEPYVLHVLRVALKQTDPDARVVAMMHDVVEDTDVSLADLRRYGYSEEIVEAIDSLSRREGESYDEFIGRVLTNPIARRIKQADIQDNMDPSRLSSSHEDSLRREQYTRALSRLTAAGTIAGGDLHGPKRQGGD